MFHLNLERLLEPPYHDLSSSSSNSLVLVLFYKWRACLLIGEENDLSLHGTLHFRDADVYDVDPVKKEVGNAWASY